MTNNSEKQQLCACVCVHLCMCVCVRVLLPLVVNAAVKYMYDFGALQKYRQINIFCNESMLQMSFVHVLI